LIGPLLVALGTFACMEIASYATHRWVMHGFGNRWHRSHHGPPEGRFERNDWFPVCFSILGIALFVLASFGPAITPLFWVAAGFTAYGVCYVLVHDVYIHRRLGSKCPRLRYLEWLRESHRSHHAFGGEPYGMLLPVVSRSLRTRTRTAPAQTLERSTARRPRRSTIRATRARL
jgi:beta-carotene 3-hydroxylase